MTPRANAITLQVIRLHQAGYHEQADDLERVQLRNNYCPDLDLWEVLV